MGFDSVVEGVCGKVKWRILSSNVDIDKVSSEESCGLNNIQEAIKVTIIAIHPQGNHLEAFKLLDEIIDISAAASSWNNFIRPSLPLSLNPRRVWWKIQFEFSNKFFSFRDLLLRAVKATKHNKVKKNSFHSKLSNKISWIPPSTSKRRPRRVFRGKGSRDDEKCFAASHLLRTCWLSILITFSISDEGKEKFALEASLWLNWGSSRASCIENISSVKHQRAHWCGIRFEKCSPLSQQHWLNTKFSVRVINRSHKSKCKSGRSA